VATWAETETVLGDGTDDPRATAPGLLRRSLSGLPPRARAPGRVAMRAGTGYFAGELARAAHEERIAFAIGAKRIAPLWRLLAGISEDGRHDAIEMERAQVAVAEYCPDWWPAGTRLLIRLARLDPGQVSAGPRSRRRRTLHPDQRALPLPELAAAEAIYGYSFILTSLDVSTPVKAAAAGHWYRHRTTVEHMFRFWKQTPGWTRPKLRDPAAADRWTWIILASYARLWLARGLAADIRLPWQPPCPPGRLTPARARRGFRNIRQTLPDLASAPKPGKPGPGRPPGSKNRQPATRHDAGQDHHPRPGQEENPQTGRLNDKLSEGDESCQ
jgi:hypothetical protein